MRRASHWDEVHLTTSYPHKSGDPSGHFVYAEALASAQRGHRVLVLAPQQNLKGNRTLVSEHHPGLFVYGFNSSHLFGSPGLSSNLRSRPWLILELIASFFTLMSSPVGLLRREGMKTLYCHWLVPAGFPFLFSLQKADSTIAVCHGSDIELVDRLPSGARRTLFFFFKGRLDSFRFVSAELRRTALTWRAPNKLRKKLQQGLIQPSPLLIPIKLPRAPRLQQQVYACRTLLAEGDEGREYYRLLTDPQSAALKSLLLTRLQPQSGSFLIVIIARLIRGKRIETALSAVACIPKAEVIVIGEGPLFEELQFNFPTAYFLGQLRRDLTLYWLAAADLLLSTSRKEGAPTVVREALSIGVQVVATQSGDLRVWAEQQPRLHIVD